MKLKYYIMYVPALFLMVGQGQGRAGAGSLDLETCHGHEERDAVALLVSNYETLPPAGTIKAKEAHHLKDIALSSCYPTFTRARSLRVLAGIEGMAAVPLVEAVLKDNMKSFYLRIEAAHVLKNILGKSRPDRLAENMALLLQSRDVRLRSTGLHILSEIETPLAQNMIQRHGLVERNLNILNVFYHK